ncbi:hypothetical protein [Streptomyces sp. NPDC096013]|uniref:hypothetical protein n=1 Tax=Streptomyces sp. NPDC096013 TaxID=3366069 RepID=UPI0037F51938
MPIPPTRTTKVMALIIALQCGLIAALIAFMLTRHFDGSVLTALTSSGASFIAVAALVRTIEKEVGFL